MTGAQCPSWCTGDHGVTGVHKSESRVHGGMCVWLLQPFTATGPNIWISAVSFPPSEAGIYAHMFAMLDKPELAATIKRLGELAEADAVFDRPQPGALPEGWHIAGEQPPADDGDGGRSYESALRHQLNKRREGDGRVRVMASDPVTFPVEAPDQPAGLPDPVRDYRQARGLNPDSQWCTIGRAGGLADPTTGRVMPLLSRLLEDQPGVTT